MSGFNFLVCISAVIALVVGVSNKAGVLAVAIIFGILGIATTLIGVAGTKKNRRDQTFPTVSTDNGWKKNIVIYVNWQKYVGKK